MSKADIPTPSKADLDYLRRQGQTRQQIAEHFTLVYGTTVTVARVKRWLETMKVVSRRTKLDEHRPRLRIREKATYASPEEGESLMEKAKAVLGDRMGERYGTYTLDGVPASSWQVLKAAGLSPKTAYSTGPATRRPMADAKPAGRRSAALA